MFPSLEYGLPLLARQQRQLAVGAQVHQAVHAGSHEVLAVPVHRYMAPWSTPCAGVSSYSVMTGVQTPAGRGFALGSEARELLLIVREQ
ncbi:uncharacterized protein PG986_007727 [Apiospora aurea]|uniref:Uncharacterized protein n=1 Tax=Apiospora aurea TaxID=335848 RepID=A0ABR1QDE6_9PEZI